MNGNNGYPYEYGPEIERPKALLPLALFLVTILTTMASGALQQGADIIADPYELVKGIPFSASLILILGTHELGHFIASRRHGVITTFPTFIPGPPLPPMIGTFGAVIKIKSPITTKAALVDIGASGPLAGFVVAILVTLWGLSGSTVIPRNAAEGSLGLGSSLIFQLLSYIAVGPLPATHDVMLNPVAFAGWIGMFVTAMNLLPLGQLDGGHLVYALIGPMHRAFSIAMIAVLVILGFLAWPGWFVWAGLISILGLWHPPIEDQDVPLDSRQRLIAAATIAVFVLTFIPSPFYIV